MSPTDDIVGWLRERFPPESGALGAVRWDTRGVTLGEARFEADACRELSVQLSRGTSRETPGWLRRVLGAGPRDVAWLHVELRSPGHPRCAWRARFDDDTVLAALPAIELAKTAEAPLASVGTLVVAVLELGARLAHAPAHHDAGAVVPAVERAPARSVATATAVENDESWPRLVPAQPAPPRILPVGRDSILAAMQDAARQPSTANWTRITSLIERWPEEEPPSLEELEPIAAALDAWPIELERSLEPFGLLGFLGDESPRRRADDAWSGLDGKGDGPASWLRLCDMVSWSDKALPRTALRRLVSAPASQRLSELALDDCGLGDAELAALADGLAGLRKLLVGAGGVDDAPSGRLGARAIGALARAPFVQHLRELAIVDAFLGTKAVRALAELPLDSLVSLDLSSSALSEGALRALGSARWLEHVRHLTLGAARCSASALTGLLRQMPALEKLTLREVPLDEASAWPALARELGRVRELDVEHCQLGLAEIAALSDAASPQLASLTLREEAALDGSIFELLARLPSLRRLGLYEMPLGGSPGALERMLEAQPALEALTLCDVGIGPAEVAALVRLPSTSLRHLDLSDNAIGLEGARALAGSAGLSGLRELWLWQCGIGGQELEALFRDPVWTQLEALSLSSNAVQGAMVDVLGACASSLRWLDLENNPLGDRGLAGLAMHRWPALEVLELCNVGAGQRGWEALASSLEARRLRILHLALEDLELELESARAVAQAAWAPLLDALGVWGPWSLDPDARVVLAASSRLAPHVRRQFED